VLDFVQINKHLACYLGDISECWRNCWENEMWCSCVATGVLGTPGLGGTAKGSASCWLKTNIILKFLLSESLDW